MQWLVKEEIDHISLDSYEMHPFYWNNLKSDSFCGHFLRIKEIYTEKDHLLVIDQFKNLKGKYRDNMKLINYLNLAEKNLKIICLNQQTTGF